MGRRARRWLLRGLRVAMGASLAGCQLIVPSDAVQCHTDSDCDARGGKFVRSSCVDDLCVAPGLACLGRLAPVVEDPSVLVHTRLRFVDVAEQPVGGIEVLVCASRDEFCDSPIGTPMVTDADGYVRPLVAKNFRGTFQVRKFPNDPKFADYMKTKVHLLPALAMDDPANLVVPAQSAVHLVPRAILAEQVGVRVPLDANAGHILGETADCNLVALTGVHLSLSSDAVGPPPLQFYFGENRSASVTATETLAEGAFGFANVPQGPVAIDATIPSLGRKLAHVEIFVDKDTISTFQLGPSYLAP